MSLLDGLKQYTTVVADTADFSLLSKYKPEDATTNPSLVLAGSQLPQYAHLIDAAVQFAKAHVHEMRDGLATDGDEQAQVLELAVDKLTVSFGLEILKVIPGRVSTEVDARLSYNTAKMVTKARHLVRLYEACGVSRDRVYVKIASTWEGIAAASVLEKDTPPINCNLTLLFAFGQAVACAQAGVSLISPFVGRILDWYVADAKVQQAKSDAAGGEKSKSPAETFAGAADPGVRAVTRIYNYYKQHGYTTTVMGASFRNIGEILELAGCDKLTIAPKLLEELANTTGTVQRRLDPAHLTQKEEKLPEITRPEDLFAGEPNSMAVEKLAEGIDGFARDTVKLEAHIGKLL